MAPDDRRAPTGIAYLDGRRFRRLLIAGVHNVERHRAELDRINVFPVPDGDTGTNLALTLRSIAAAVRRLDSSSLGEVVRSAADASVLGARGNSGMLFSHLLLGFAEAIGDRRRAAAVDVAHAFRQAADHLRDVLEDPREGTLLTVASDMAAAGDTDARDLARWLDDVQRVARASLARTQEMLPALTEAGVVDAGARGLVEFFEGVVQLVEGRLSTEDLAASSTHEAPGAPSLYAAREAGVGADEGRYCTQVAIRGNIPATAELRSALASLGTSLLVVRSGALAKVHIHSDRPDEVVDVLGRFGTIASKHVEDTMLAGTASHHTAVLTDSAADLPRAWVERHGVTVVPLQVIVGDDVYRDGVDLQSDELLELMLDPANPLPKTSQPSPAAFRAACRRAVDHGAEELLGVFVSGAVSGTLASAAAVLREFDELPTAAVDSRSGSLGIGLLVIRAIELLERGLALPDVVAELRRVRDQSNVFFTVDTMEYLLRSGRIGRTRAWLGGMLDLKPILTLTSDGRIVPIDRARGREAVVERVLALVDERVDGSREVRFGVAHFGAPETTTEIARILRSRYPASEVLVGPAAAALGVHTGPGAWALAYQIEDGGPTFERRATGTHHASRGSQTV
ncbi:MAG TPA: DegV family protein [Gemmatimonadota bacterium]|nr:DegV family protein [Gemmatimonadota bacterium]